MREMMVEAVRRLAGEWMVWEVMKATEWRGEWMPEGDEVTGAEANSSGTTGVDDSKAQKTQGK